MYRQEDRVSAAAEAKKRWIVTLLPGALLIVVGIIVFVICQIQRLEWGWIFACACTVLGGAYVLFFYGVYLKPVLLYKKHVDYMLDGRKRETTGLLQEVAQEVTDKDGLDCYAIIVNVGDKNDPEDERLFYVDALKGRPGIPPGSRITVISNDKMVAELRLT
ncbi:MAG: hypothetical protein VB099_20630 [Candidatus Limiplasma sp.]|nr:hypothetical protein [Candidatus Limiplasma sp.]